MRPRPGRVGALGRLALVPLLLAGLGAPPAAQGEPGPVPEELREEVSRLERKHGPEDARVGRALDGLAEALRAHGRYREAIEEHRRAQAVLGAALGPDDPDVLVNRNNLAFTLQLAGDLDGARSHYEAVLERAPEIFGEPSAAVGQIALNLAVTCLGLDELEEAEHRARQSVASYEAVHGPGHPSVAGALGVVATARMRLGDLNEAGALHERALEIMTEALGPEHVAVTGPLNNLSEIQLLAGDLEGARRSLERAVSVWEQQGSTTPELVTSLSNLAKVLYEQGDLEGARVRQERALVLLERDAPGRDLDLSAHLNLLGDMLRAAGEPEEAREIHLRALEIRRERQGEEGLLVAASLGNLGLVHEDLGELDEAAALLEAALEIYEARLGPDHPAAGRLLENLASVRRGQGDLERALELQRRGLAVLSASRGSRDPEVARAHDALARLEAALGRKDQAREHLRALAAIQDARLPLVLGTMPETEVVSYRARLRGHLETQVDVGLACGEPDDLVFLAERVLAWKAHGLRPVAAARRALGGGPAANDPRLERLRALNASLSSAALGLASSDPESLLVGSDALREERAALERALLDPDTVSLSPPPPRWSDVRARLPSDGAYVDLAVHVPWASAGTGAQEPSAGASGEPRLLALVTRPGGESPAAVDLGPVSVLERVVDDWRRSVAAAGAARGIAPAGDEGGIRAAEAAATRLVWEPLEPLLDGARVVFLSPAGPLARLPPAALRDRSGGYLVERHTFVQVTDVDRFLAPAAGLGAKPSLLVVGGVDFEASAASEKESGAIAASPSAPGSRLRAPLAGARWPPLPFTLEEARTVADLHGRVVPAADRLLLGAADALESRLKQDLGRFEVVHLATHGFLAPETSGTGSRLASYLPGLLSGVVCSGAAGEPGPGEDGYLTAEELGWLDLERVRLVVLSACETGLGRPRAGEGLLGLRRAFLAAGAERVVSSLWAVPDDGTARLMEAFYRFLWEEGLPVHEALRRAQLERLEADRARGGDGAPNAWGAFVLDGAWGS